MIRKTLFCALVLITICYAVAENENVDNDNWETWYTDEQLETLASQFKTDVVEKNGLTCEKYEDYCTAGKGKVELGTEEDCKTWLRKYLCEGATGGAGLRKILKDIFDNLEESDDDD